MLLNTLEHIGFRVAGLAGVIWGLEKSNILNNVLGQSDNQITLALKTSAVLSGSEFLSDHLLSIIANVRVPKLYDSIQQLGIAYISNAVVLLAIDKLKIDEMIVDSMASDEKKALELAVLFVIVQEISFKLINLYFRRTY